MYPSSSTLLLPPMEQYQLVEVDRLVTGSAAAVPNSAEGAAAAAPPAAASGRPPGLWGEPLQGEEGMGAGDQSTVMMETLIAPALVVIQAEFALQLSVVELDHPAQPGQAGEAFGLRVFRKVREPVVRRRVCPLGPLDDQPFRA